jgi:histidinol-phosphate aminotransferase
MLEVREAVRNLRAYHPPLAGRRGLRLDFNENTIGCSPRVVARLRALDAESLARYPEREPVEAEVAEALRLKPSQVLLTNGVDEAIHLLCGSYLERGDDAIIVVPTFAMYAMSAAAAGAKVVEIKSGPDFAFPLGALRSQIRKNTRLIAVANPNNPTGAVASSEVLLEIAKLAPQASILVDEAYFEFHGESVIEYTSSLPNLFVTRTFSKAYGLAGLRIGLLVGEIQQMALVRRLASPYNVNAAALAVLPEALGDLDYVEKYVEQVREGRRQLEEELENLRLRYWPSRANFVLVRIGEKHGEFLKAMRERGILVRDRSADPGCEGCVRLTLGSIEHTGVLINALRVVAEKLRLQQEVRT